MTELRQDLVVLVDGCGRDLYGRDGVLSALDKLEAHRQGLLHRAISVFVFNEDNGLLLQKRAATKYHSPGKWTNTCCTHPRPGEAPLHAARRRLREEMGLSVKLGEIFTFSYTAEVGNGLVENEFDHVFFGVCGQHPNPDPDEVDEWRWLNLEALKGELVTDPGLYSAWLRECFNTVFEYRSRPLRGVSI